MATAYLALEDKSVYQGQAFGALHQAEGEVVFNTGMTGYQEVLTDPSYCGQIVTMTYPLIGNYGVNDSDPESAHPQVRGFIVREYSQLPSNWKCQQDLDTYLKQAGIMALCGIDTRMLTKRLRNHGTLRGRLCLAPPTEEDFAQIQRIRIDHPVQQVTCQAAYELPGKGKRVAVLDFGLKKSILTSLQTRDCALRVFPALTKAEEVLAWNPDGIMLTNGPGDPKDNGEIIEEVKKLIGQRPIFGICLGHQLMALANGADTEKLKYGHRGANHPVKDLDSGRVCITSQNHGYTVSAASLKDNMRISHVNWNDQTIEGLVYTDHPSFTVQFHPEAAPGPQDTAYLFDRFVAMM
ncbi:MAG: carbamoyl phosphate synthase small subunit [Clostridiales bacterium]|nr:carbamoyl phosphate synthase small subunit [Clostridiales bacterium]